MALSSLGTTHLPGIQWGAVGVLLILAGVAFRSIQHGITVRDQRSQSHGSKRAKIHAAIVAESIIPCLADVLCQIPRAVLKLDHSDEELLAAVQDSLHGVDFLDNLEKLSEYHTDLRALDRAYRGSLWWAKVRAFAAVIAVLSMLGPAAEFVFEQVDPFLTDASRFRLYLLTGLVVMIAFGAWLREVILVNVLARLGDKYAVAD